MGIPATEHTIRRALLHGANNGGPFTRYDDNLFGLRGWELKKMTEKR
jgi:hypothetical protein